MGVDVRGVASIRRKWLYLPVRSQPSKVADRRLVSRREQKLGWKAYLESTKLRERGKGLSASLGEFMVNLRHRVPYAFATYTVTNGGQRFRSSREAGGVPMAETVIERGS